MDTCEVEKQGQVSNEMDKLERNIAALVQSTDRLEGKLIRILLDSPPTAEETKEDELVPLANGVRNFRKNIMGIDNRISSIADRLEL